MRGDLPVRQVQSAGFDPCYKRRKGKVEMIKEEICF